MRTGLNIHKRRDGRWEGRYKVDGKYKSVYSKTYRETKDKLQTIIINKRDSKNTKVLYLKDMYKQYITCKNAILKESSLSTYHYLYNKHLKQIENYTMSDLEDKNKLYAFINQKNSYRQNTLTT